MSRDDRTPSPVGRSPKIRAWHLDRVAVVYVRQSSAHQVAENQESRARQYALADRAVDLGWPRDRVLVIDEDQGKSGSTAVGRPGFQRLLAEVGLDHVGLVLGIEMSRLARSCKDWHQLLELCGLFRTLLADQDGVYDPTDPNDRLLLGLKGTMSEAELHVLRGRLRQGILNKVRRAAHFLGAPTGYVRTPDGDFELDPDEQVRGAVAMIFDLFDRCGTARRVAQTLIDRGVRIGVRSTARGGRGLIDWRPAAISTVAKILKHPVYAGVYVYGRTQVDPRRRTAGGQLPSRVRVPREQYHAYQPGVCPAYITLDRFEANQRKLAENRARLDAKGAPRNGAALLAGLVRCGRCQRRMAVSYGGSSRSLRYACNRVPDVRGGCTHQFHGDALDQVVATQVLLALQPGELEWSLAAAQGVLRERAALDRNWQQRVERARLDAERAERQYQAVEPENRLVARTLERRWEEALKAARQAEEEYARFRQAQPPTPTAGEVDRLRVLSRDLPQLWEAPTTAPIDRQQIVRTLVEQVVATTDGDSDRLHVRITWAGGHHTEHVTRRRVKQYHQMADFPRLRERVRTLRAAGWSCQRIAEQLNTDGFVCPYAARGFWAKNVQRFLRQYLPGEEPKARPRRHLHRLPAADEYLVTDLIGRLRICRHKLYRWVARGWIHSRVARYGKRAVLVCWADAAEMNRLRELARTPQNWPDLPLPERLTTPGPRPKGATGGEKKRPSKRRR